MHSIAERLFLSILQTKGIKNMSILSQAVNGHAENGDASSFAFLLERFDIIVIGMTVKPKFFFFFHHDVENHFLDQSCLTSTRLSAHQPVTVWRYIVGIFFIFSPRQVLSVIFSFSSHSSPSSSSYFPSSPTS